ncbi:MAG: RsmB/NOP family class I SAM-dependent RNA methyltransferase [Sphingomonadaceae bacterium]
MTPSARIQAAIEILDQVIAAAIVEGAPADRIISDYFRQRRYAGSKDRRAVREWVYRAIRACGPVPQSGRAAMLLLARSEPSILPLFDGTQHGPAPVETDENIAESGVAPDWLVERLAQSGISGPAVEALLDRAPLDIRVNTIKYPTGVPDMPENGTPLGLPRTIRFPTGTSVEQWDAYQQGAIEVQDYGSQMACSSVAVQPDETVIDLCAGAGGKTLALAAAMNNQGTLIASDTNRARLSRLMPRAKRAGASMIETVLLDPQKDLQALAPWLAQADAVLVDAPCSGTGTWRRNPEARWRLTPELVRKFSEAQTCLLGLAAKLVRPGGRIVYVTCSLLDEEGRNVIDRFLSDYPDWQATPPCLPAGKKHGQGIRLNPSDDETDGFFIACLTSPC